MSPMAFVAPGEGKIILITFFSLSVPIVIVSVQFGQESERESENKKQFATKCHKQLNLFSSSPPLV